VKKLPCDGYDEASLVEYEEVLKEEIHHASELV
jgi:hypothetical protein